MSLRNLVLNTAKGRFNAKIDGRNTVFANPEGVDGTPTRYGLEVAVRRLRLTGAGARALDRALGGEISFFASPLTLSPALADLLNRTFADPRGLPPPFATGESLGHTSYGTRTTGKPH